MSLYSGCLLLLIIDVLNVTGKWHKNVFLVILINLSPLQLLVLATFQQMFVIVLAGALAHIALWLFYCITLISSVCIPLIFVQWSETSLVSHVFITTFSLWVLSELYPPYLILFSTCIHWLLFVFVCVFLPASDSRHCHRWRMCPMSLQLLRI